MIASRSLHHYQNGSWNTIWEHCTTNRRHRDCTSTPASRIRCFVEAEVVEPWACSCLEQACCSLRLAAVELPALRGCSSAPACCSCLPEEAEEVAAWACNCLKLVYCNWRLVVVAVGPACCSCSPEVVVGVEQEVLLERYNCSRWACCRWWVVAEEEPAALAVLRCYSCSLTEVVVAAPARHEAVQPRSYCSRFLKRSKIRRSEVAVEVNPPCFCYTSSFRMMGTPLEATAVSNRRQRC